MTLRSYYSPDLDALIRRWAFASATIVALLLYLVPSAFAADPGSYSDSHDSFTLFLSNVGAYINAVLAPGSNAAAFIEAFFLFAVVYKLVVAVASWMLNAAHFTDVFQAIILIAIVRIIMTNYQFFTNMLMSWSGDFASAIQEPIVGTGDTFFVVSYIQNIISAIAYEDVGFFDGFKALLALFYLWGLLALLSVLAFFAVAWGVWGFALSQLIGWMFIPFLLFKRTEFLFDGWLKFMVGFLIYGVIARVNIVLVLIMLSSYFGLPVAGSLGPDAPIVIESADISDIGGLAALLVISILSLIMTGRFAMTIAGGVGGFGTAVGALAIAATRVARVGA